MNVQDTCNGNTSITSSTPDARHSAVTKLRSYLADPTKMIVGPGVFDGFSARMALNAGFDCLYMVIRIGPPLSYRRRLNSTCRLAQELLCRD